MGGKQQICTENQQKSVYRGDVQSKCDRGNWTSQLQKAQANSKSCGNETQKTRGKSKKLKLILIPGSIGQWA